MAGSWYGLGRLRPGPSVGGSMMEVTPVGRDSASASPSLGGLRVRPTNLLSLRCADDVQPLIEMKGKIPNVWRSSVIIV